MIKEEGMSFSAETKNEMAHTMPERKCCMLAEIAGFIRMSGSVELLGGGKLAIHAVTEHPAVARHYKTLIKAYFDVDASIGVSKNTNLKKGNKYNIAIGPEDLSEQILREIGILMIKEGMNYISDGIYDGIIKTKCCRKAFLRGAFLGSGTVTNPSKAYHFEIDCDTKILANDLKKILNSFEGITAKTTIRKEEHVVYIKDSDQIIDVLAIMGAHSKIFDYENVKIEKEIKNKANRISNCDNANIDKAIEAGRRQLGAISKIEKKRGLDSLSEKLKAVAVLRIEYPEASLTEIGEMLDPPLKKAGVSKRLSKIEEISKDL